MTTIQEITEIVRTEVLGSLKPNFNRDETNKQLEIAKTTDNLGAQTLAILKVVNRYPNVTDPQIKSELQKFSDTLRLIKAVNKLPKNTDTEHIKLMYDKAVETFKNR